MLGLDDVAPHEDEGLSDTESNAASTSATGTMIVLEEFGKRIQKVLNKGMYFYSLKISRH